MTSAVRLLTRKKLIFVGIPAILLFLVADYFFHIAIFRYVFASDELSQQEIKNISKSVGSIICPGKIIDGKYEGVVAGSGTYLKINSPQGKTLKVLVTNEHVAQLHDSEQSYLNNCSVDFAVEGKIPKHTSDGANRISFSYTPDSIRRGTIADLAILKPNEVKNVNDFLTNDEQAQGTITKEVITDILEKHVLVDNGRLFRICDVKNPIGKKVYVFGYPSSADTAEFPSQATATFLETYRLLLGYEPYDQYRIGRHLAVTEGIISGKERDNYFTTALIDTGSSGGLAVIKQGNKPCLFGIPTWGTIGDLTTLGVIQPFQNIFNSGFNWEKISTNK